MSEPGQHEERRKKLDPKKLMAEAEAASEFSDYGDMSFVESLAGFMDRAAREVDFTAEGLESFRGDILRHLINRLRAQADIQSHPEILQEDVSDPIIVIGLPRTGTTKMQRMLASAPNVQKLYLWRMLNPARFPDAVPGQRDPRMAAVGMGDGMGSDRLDGNNALQAAHELAAGQVEEEFVLFDFFLDESIRGFGPYTPLFFHDHWKNGNPEREIDRKGYRYVKMLLQYLQWQDGGKRNRPWILKSVSHIAHMDALLESFPNATLVHCHRDPRSTMPSLGKLMFELWSTKANLDKKQLGPKLLDWSAASMKRYLESRARLRLDGRILDVRYESIRDDAMSIMREVYKRARLELTPKAEKAMMDWENSNEQGKHGKHAYSLDEFALSETSIDEAFAEYMRRFFISR